MQGLEPAPQIQGVGSNPIGVAFSLMKRESLFFLSLILHDWSTIIEQPSRQL